MANKFSFLRVTIYPGLYPNTDVIKLQVEVEVNGQKLTVTDHLHNDYFDSTFDRSMEWSMEYIKHKIKDSLKLLNEGKSLDEYIKPSVVPPPF